MARDLAGIRRDDARQNNLTDSGDPELVAVGSQQNGAEAIDNETWKRSSTNSTLAWNKNRETKFDLWKSRRI